MEQKRSSFSSRIGFVLAAAGSAVGLGQPLAIPYLAARYGGGIFLLVYLILALTFGFSLDGYRDCHRTKDPSVLHRCVQGAR